MLTTPESTVRVHSCLLGAVPKYAQSSGLQTQSAIRIPLRGPSANSTQLLWSLKFVFSYISVYGISESPKLENLDIYLEPFHTLLLSIPTATTIVQHFCPRQTATDFLLHGCFLAHLTPICL